MWKRVLLNYFEKKYGFEAKLFNSAITVVGLHCELYTNKLDTNSSKVKITIPSKSWILVNKILNSRELIQVESTNSNQIICLEGRYYQMNTSSDAGAYLILNVDYCRIYKEFEEIIPSRIGITVYIDETRIFRRRNVINLHSSKGLLAGWNYNKKIESEDEWIEQKDTIDSPIGKLNFIPSFVFTKDESQNYRIIAEQQIIDYELEENGLNVDSFINQFIDVINKHLKMVTLLEGEKINWYYINILIYAKEKIPINEIEIFTRNKIQKRKKEDISHYYKFFESYQNILPSLVSSYNCLTPQQQEIFETILRRFIVAATHDKIDTQIIYWHSCLDLIVKWSKVRERSFSQKLIKACKKKDIKWLDLFPYMIEEKVFSTDAVQLKLNKIRNEMIHDGEYLKDYGTAILEIRKVRALSERFLMKILNVEYANTGIGLEHGEP